MPERTDPQILYWIGFCGLVVRLWQWAGLSALAARLCQWLQQAHTQRGSAQQQTAAAQEQATLVVKQTGVAAEEQAVEVHWLKQNVALSRPFEFAMRHAVEDIGRLRATFEIRGITLAIPPDYF